MKVIVTGGSGFVGSNLINLMKTKNEFDVLSLDKRPSQWHSELSEIININDVDKLAQIRFPADAIVHLAAEHRDDVYPKTLYYDVNVTGTENIVKHAELNNIQKIIFFSSVAVYGFADVGTDEKGKINPFNDYGKTKWQAEQILQAWFDKDPSNRTLTIIRPTVIFGPRNRGNFYNLINQIQSGKFLMVGQGENKKSLAYINNITAFVLHCLNTHSGLNLFNYVDKPESNMNHIIDTIYKGLNKEQPKLRVPYSIAFSGASLLDVVAKITKKKFPVSAIRIKKFCADTSFNTSIDQQEFTAPFSVENAIVETVNYEFNNPDKDDVVFYTE